MATSHFSQIFISLFWGLFNDAKALPGFFLCIFSSLICDFLTCQLHIFHKFSFHYFGDYLMTLKQCLDFFLCIFSSLICLKKTCFQQGGIFCGGRYQQEGIFSCGGRYKEGVGRRYQFFCQLHAQPTTAFQSSMPLISSSG